MTNLNPAITFVVAVFLRLEKLDWNTAGGKAKVLGTITGVVGAMVLTFYKGPELSLWKTSIDLLQMTSSTHRHDISEPGGQNMALGAVLALASCFSYSIWLVIQSKAEEDYPFPLSITALMTTWAFVQGALFAVCTEKHWNSWILGWNIRLLTVVVAGVLGSGVMFTLMAWCLRLRGPVFVSAFNPLLLLMVAIGGSIFLNEKLHLGMLFGGLMIIVGLYVLLWGKGKEREKMLPDAEGQVGIASGAASENGGSHGGGWSRVIPMEEELET